MAPASRSAQSSATSLLGGEEARRYLGTLRRLLGIARAGAQYPDPRRIDTSLGFLGPDGGGERQSISIERASGLPALHELARLRAASKVAREQKAAPLRALAQAELAPVSHSEVRLVERSKGQARFQIIRDLIEVKDGCFVRFSFRVAQKGASHIGLERSDLSRPTQAFQRELERSSASDAEVALLLLSALPGLQVEEVVRGQIGPLWPVGGPVPKLVRGVLSQHPQAAILCLALERAGPGVAQDRCPDPFSALYRHSLSPAARVAAEERRTALGYRVSKERRLCCSPEVEGPLRAALSAAGHPLVVRSR